ncbi:uncharacterized protein J3R85_007950 [Psidium guajava]|nr:uncharacterized protein J3R85_007950 [Psidium guajava]
MRKSVQKLGSSTGKIGEPMLMRFLIARSMDADKAAKMFVKWQEWRSTWVPNGFVPESEIGEELEARKIFLQGLSRSGQPLMVALASKHFPSKEQLQFKKFVIYVLDKTIARCVPYSLHSIKHAFTKELNITPETDFHLLNFSISLLALDTLKDLLTGVSSAGPCLHSIFSSFKGREIGNEKVIIILDLQNISYKNIDVRGLITGFQFLQAYYPERLAKFFILNMPRFFVSIWRMITRFLEKATLEKVVIVSNEDEREDLVKEIGCEVLPEEFGGKAKLVPIQDVVLPPLDN